MAGCKVQSANPQWVVAPVETYRIYSKMDLPLVVDVKIIELYKAVYWPLALHTLISHLLIGKIYEGWNFNSGNN